MNKILLIAAGLLLATHLQAAERPAKPNVILMLVDDVGWQDLKCYDIDDPCPYESPNLDALAKRGVDDTGTVRKKKKQFSDYALSVD